MKELLSSHQPALAWILGAALAGGLALGAVQDPEPSLRSKDATERLQALELTIGRGEEDLAKTLHKLLKDKDWEMQLAVVRALGEHGEERSVKTLAKLSHDAPLRRLRLAAAEALGKLDAEEGLKTLSSKLRRDTVLSAMEALTILGPYLQEPKIPSGLSRLLKEEDPHLRAIASGTLIALQRGQRAELLKRFLADPAPAVRARCLEVATRQPLGSQVQAIVEFLGSPDLSDVVLRRALLASLAGMEAAKESGTKDLGKLIRELCGAPKESVARRGCLLVEEALGNPAFEDLDWIVLTQKAREHGDAGVRAEAARCLGLLDPQLALPVVRQMASKDSSSRVRRAALLAALTLAPPTEEEDCNWALERFGAEESPEVRKALAVALGRHDLALIEKVAKALAVACEDSDWKVAACAAVSLGLTRCDLAPVTLSRLLQTSTDWRLRGAAVVGLTKALHPDGLPPIISALADSEPLVARTAHGYLSSLRPADAPGPDPEVWSQWWQETGSKRPLRDAKAQRERNRKYGYSTSHETIFRGMDVLVLESRGDHIQTVLERLAINHRLTSGAKVPESGLDAGGVFVSNCTGEMEPADIERLDWFVHVGGYLFGSCWALTETIQRLAPGIVGKLPTTGEVMNRVLASPCHKNSPYLEGVFGAGVQPIYSLVGSHLIEVQQPERVEVLVDSVQCAQDHGDGNLACWFQLGHGTIMDSANHFDVQGLTEATHLDKAEDRMAYAMDHMGASFALIRETAKEKFWGSNHRAAQEVFDDSVLRLLSNFVRLRRLEGR